MARFEKRPPEIKKLVVENTDANREELSRRGTAGGRSTAERKAAAKSENAMWEQVSEERKVEEAKKLAQSTNEHILSPDGENTTKN